MKGGKPSQEGIMLEKEGDKQICFIRHYISLESTF